MKEQRRGRSIAMDTSEINAFLQGERVCRVATISADGSPHVSPLWFVWDDAALWLNSTVRSQRWQDIGRDPRVSVVVDAGEEFNELRGVELRGEVAVASEVPRTAKPREDLAAVERAYAEKYSGTGKFVADGRHAWLRLEPGQVLSWDFRKNPALLPRRRPS